MRAVMASAGRGSLGQRRGLLDEQAVERDGGEDASNGGGRGSVAVGVCHAAQRFTEFRTEGALDAAWIAEVSAGASMMLRARSRPCWRMPTLTTGRANEAASIMPLEELPTMRCDIAQQAPVSHGVEVDEDVRAGAWLPGRFVRSMSAWPPASALG
jgi:hypothetical protein